MCLCRYSVKDIAALHFWQPASSDLATVCNRGCDSLTDNRFALLFFRMTLIILCLGFLGAVGIYQKPRGPEAVKGLLDLRSAERAVQSVMPRFNRWVDPPAPAGQIPNLDLSGEWLFAGNVFLKSADMEKDASVSWSLCQVPAAWSDRENMRNGMPYAGYGTYHLKILLPGSGGTYGLKTTTIRSAYRVFANGEEVLAGGSPGTSQASTQAVNFADACTFIVHGPVLDLEVQVANYLYPGSGIVMPIRFGMAGNIQRERIRDIICDVLIVGVLLLGVLFFLCQYLVAKRKTSLDSASLIFTLFVLFLALNTLTHSEKLLYYAFPGMQYLTFCRVQMVCVIASYFFLYWYVMSIFPKVSQKRMIPVIGILTLAGVVLVLTTTLFLEAGPLLVFQGIGFIMIVLIFIGMLRGLLHETIGKYYIAAGVCCAIAMFTGTFLDNSALHVGALVPKWFEPLFVLSQVLYVSHVQAVTRERLMDREAAFLNAQIKPHFLFNTLNTIQSLCYSDARKAGGLLAELGVFLRGRFDLKSTAGLVLLGQELDVTHAYISIEKARFASCFTYSENVNPAFLAFKLPPLTIQPLVENALRHGLKDKETGGLISLKVEQEVRHLNVEICDNGVGVPAEVVRGLIDGNGSAQGIGLRNIHERLKNQYGFGLNFQAGADGIGTRISFRIPMEKNRAGNLPGNKERRNRLFGRMNHAGRHSAR